MYECWMDQWILVQKKYEYTSFIVTYRTLNTQFETKFEKAKSDLVSDQVEISAVHSGKKSIGSMTLSRRNMDGERGAVFTQSAIVWTHRVQLSPFWLILTALDPNCYLPVITVCAVSVQIWAQSCWPLTTLSTCRQQVKICPTCTCQMCLGGRIYLCKGIKIYLCDGLHVNRFFSLQYIL